MGRPDLAAWRRVHYPALFLVMPIVLVYAPKGSVLLLALAALPFVVSALVGKRFAGMVSPKLLMLAPLLLWAGATLTWTIEIDHAGRVFVSVVALALLAGITFRGGARDLGDGTWGLTRFLAVAAMLHLVFIGIENATSGWIIEMIQSHKGKGQNDHIAFINPGNGMLAILAVPYTAAIAAAWGRVAAGAFFVAALAVLLTGPMTGAKVAVMAGAVAWGLAWVLPRIGPWVIYAGFTLVLVATPFVLLALPDLIPNLRATLSEIGGSLHHRWWIWEFASQRIVEKPVLGWGIDASRVIPGGERHLFASDWAEIMPLHPHNGFLQLWLELGGIGVACFIALMAALPRYGARVGSAAVHGTAAACLTLGQLNYGLWQNWWLAAVALAFCVTAFVALERS